MQVHVCLSNLSEVAVFRFFKKHLFDSMNPWRRDRPRIFRHSARSCVCRNCHDRTYFSSSGSILEAELPSHVNCVASNMCGINRVASNICVIPSHVSCVAPNTCLIHWMPLCPPNTQSHKNRNTYSNTMALRRACMQRVRNVMTTLVAGHLCFCLLLHASSRFSDSLRIEKLEVTTNAKICLAESVIRRHKTATTFQKKAKFPH